MGLLRRIPRILCVAGVALWAMPAATPGAAAQPRPPEPGFAVPELASDRCEDETIPACKRLRFTYGPLAVTPGNNAQLVGPVTIEKPAYDGYMTRIDSNIYRASDGKVPPVDILHLHHGVWASLPQYGSFLPFYGTGEEKTVMRTGRGYGMRVRPTDAWLLNYMLHNQVTEPETVFITYDIDYVPLAAAERSGLKPVVPVWLDVRHGDRPFYPVFNVQRGAGKVNPQTGRRECAYPRETCAPFDPFGDDQLSRGAGYEYEIPKRFEGTLVGMGGHLHPGGLRDEVDLVRGGETRRIFDSEAVYYDPAGPVSWDLSMTVTRPDWKVEVEAGDRLRLNAVYDSEQASWYEGMGIVMAFLAPGDDSGVDPFQKVRVPVTPAKGKRKARRKSRRGAGRRRAARGSKRPRSTRRCVRARSRRGARRVRRSAADSATARRKTRRRRCRRPAPRYRYEYVPLETKGVVTHGHLPENSNYGGRHVRPLPDKEGPLIEDVVISAFNYFPGDLSRANGEGIPRVRADRRLTFWNSDLLAGIWHTVTTCKPPCTGTPGISYPLADGDPALDSLELGYNPAGNHTQPAAQRHAYGIVPRQAGMRPGSTYTYFCRVHPFMRGGFKVVD